MSNTTTQLPPGFLPPGVTLDNSTLAPEVLSSAWSLTALAGVFLGLRVFAKLYTRRGLWLDDYVLIASWVTVFATAILTTIAVQHGLGKHVYNVPLDDAAVLNLISNIIITVTITSAALSKTSFAITVLRLVSGWMTKFTWFIIISMNFFLAINIVISWLGFQATPRMSPPTGSEATAIAAGVYYGVFATVYSAAMDFILVGVAWHVVSKLRALRHLREKVGVGLAMSMGIVAGVSSVVKAAVLPQLISGGDVTFVVVKSHICSMAEASTTIIAVSVPLLRILFSHVKNTTTAAAESHSRSRSTTSKRFRGGSISLPSSAISGGQHGLGRLPSLYETYLAGRGIIDSPEGTPIVMEDIQESVEDEVIADKDIEDTDGAGFVMKGDEEQALPRRLAGQDSADIEPEVGQEMPGLAK